MAMTIRLQAEDGEKVDEVDDPQGLIVDRLPSLSGKRANERHDDERSQPRDVRRVML
jgi:hypothetical protein